MMQKVMWGITALFAAVAFLLLCTGDMASVFYAVIALIALPYRPYKEKWKALFPLQTARVIIAVSAILASIVVQPIFWDVPWDPAESAPSNIGTKLGAALYEITLFDL